MIGAILRKVRLISLLVAVFRVATEGHVLHQVSNFVDFVRLREFITSTKNNPNIKNWAAWRINEKAPRAIF